MKIVRLSLGVTVVCCLMAAVAWPVFGLGDGAVSQVQSTPAASQPSLAGSLLMVPGVDSLDGGQQSSDQAAAYRANPEAASARARSRSAYAHLTPGQVRHLLNTSFPAVIDRLAGGTPELPAGTRFVGYRGTNAIQVALPGHRLGIVESTSPVAVRVTHGRYTPIDLALVESGGGYAPARSDVTVSMPRELSDGVRTPQNGVSLTPIDLHGRPVSGRGVVDGSTVLYANTQSASDTLVKPTATGFQMDDVLRSAASPQTLRFKIGVPDGAAVTQDPGSGSVRVTAHGSTITTILPPGATDAAGANVPASMAVSGHTLVLAVGHDAGSYMYPIYVDPEVNDNQLATTSGGKRSNWEFKSTSETKFGHKAVYEGLGKEHLETTGTAEYKGGEDFAYWGYETKGNSKIYELKVKTSAKNKLAKIESFLKFQTGAFNENRIVLSTEGAEPEYSEKASTICAWNTLKVEECLPASGNEKNVVRFQQSATASPGANFKFLDTMSEGIVSISESAEEHSTTSFNTASPEVEGEVEGKTQKRVNALYGSGSWLSKSAGALQPIARDPGIGVAATRLEYEKSAGSWETLSEHHYLESENACQGVQCYAEHAEYWTVDPKLPDGEDKIRYRAEEAIAGTVSPTSEAESTKTVRVDTSAPHGISITGLPFGDELSEKPYKIVAEITDGVNNTVASSGVKRLALFVSGHEISEVGTQTGCTVPKGECTAKAEWSLNGAELGAGHHAIVFTATDNAGNEYRTEKTISIRHSTPVSLGPGSVDLQSGDYSLSATDVSMGSGLTVSRNYSSRATQSGIEGSLGSEWSISLGSSESLTELVDGGVTLTSADGAQSIFANLGAGKFEAPTGDSNLTLELEENKVTKEKLAYYLKNSAAGTSVKFTLPAGSKQWVPTKQEGTVATDTVTYAYKAVPHQDEFHPASAAPTLGGVAAGPDGNIWYTDSHNNKIGKMNPAGFVLAEYATQTEYEGGVPGQSIVPGPDSHVWFLQGKLTVGMKRRVVKTTTSGAQTTYLLPESKTAAYMTAGPDGNMWFTEPFAKKVGKVTPSGAFTQYTVPKGEPYSITAGPDGNLWFTTVSPGRVDKITPAGTVTEYTPATENPGRGAQSIAAGPDGNVWFTDYDLLANKYKIDKITPGGIITAYTLSKSTTEGIITGPDKSMWFSQAGGMGKITMSGVISEYELEPGSGMTIGPEGNVWFADNWNKTIDRTTPSTKINEPTEVMAPVPAGVSCSPTLKAGCRSLKFYYEGLPSSARLSEVGMSAYNPSLKEMQETTVARYSYDSRGELIAEWDPRYGNELQTSYGYDSEGHVTALTPPGQETWAFIYGAIPGDAGTGRLLKISRAAASVAVWKGGEAPKITSAPSITGSAVVGVRMTVSDGEWSGSPIAYGYQWERCDSSGEGCTPIAGATNANYKPTVADAWHTLVVAVSATNGAGSVSATTATVKIEERKFVEYSLPYESEPFEITSGPDANLWFTNGGTDKIGKITTSGSLTQYAAGHAEPQGIASGPDKNLWFVEHLFRNVDHITTSGGLATYTLTRGNTSNVGITAGPDGNMWFTEEAAKEIGKINTNDEVLAEYELPTGSKPYGITMGPDGNLWFTNFGTSKIGKITTSGTITEYALPAGSNPYDISAGPDGELWFTENGTNKVGEITTIGNKLTEYALPAGSRPRGITSYNLHLWITEYSTSKVAQVTTSTGAISEYVLPTGSRPSGITVGPDGFLWFTDTGTDKIVQFNPSGPEGPFTEGSVRSPQVGYALEYNVPLTGSGLPSMSSSEVAKWGQSDTPVEATAIVPPDADQGWPAASYQRATIDYLDGSGHLVNESKPSEATHGSISTTEYNEMNDVVRTLSPDNRQKALEAGGESVDVAKSLSTYFMYREECSKESENKHEAEGVPGTRLCETEGPQHQVKYMAGGEQKESLARLHTKYFYDENSPGGATYNLVTKTSSLAELTNEEEVEVRKTTISYSGQGNLGWTLRAPTSVTVDPEGKKLTTTTLYNSATGEITETRAPGGSGGESAHDMKSIYYSAGENTEGYPSCGSHPEWAGLLCETLPAKQPSTGPKLPVTTTTYNIWDEPETITETFGSTVRTKKESYDKLGRLIGSETTSTAGVALPRVTDEYDPKTGLLDRQSTFAGGVERTITSAYNNLGQLTEYTDADGNITKYRYAGPENDWLLEEVADGSAGGTGKQTYSYNAITKLREELTDSAAGVFTASYDAEGKLVSEVYPNAMCAKSSYNPTGEPTHVEYIKTSNCSESAPTVWYSETRNPAVRGETFARSSTLANEAYTYDTMGRLTEARETPAGEGCRVRLYAYDEESNRTSQTTRVPGGGGSCATEGGAVQSHTYSEANRLTDAGVGYDSFGNITKLPAADAEGHELASTFYVDNAVATQSQNGASNSYYLDPDGRIRETVAGANATTTHYDGPGEAVAWTSETGGKSTRNIPGIDGALAATQANGGTPVLQLHDLQGDVIATAALSPTETKLLSTYNSTEFGVPNAEKAPPKFAWLGAGDVASAFSSGVITYGATSYVPQIGRVLQGEAVESPGAPYGSGAGAAYTSQEEPWVFQGAAAEAAQAPGLEAARERAAWEAALAAAVDPHERVYMNKTKAREKAEGLWAAQSLGELAEIIDIPADWVEAAIGMVSGLATHSVYEWFDEAASKLWKCGNNKWNILHSQKVNICRIEYGYYDVLGTKLVNFASPAWVWECLKVGEDPCFNEVFVEKKESKCALGLICIA